MPTAGEARRGIVAFQQQAVAQSAHNIIRVSVTKKATNSTKSVKAPKGNLRTVDEELSGVQHNNWLDDEKRLVLLQEELDRVRVEAVRFGKETKERLREEQAARLNELSESVGDGGGAFVYSEEPEQVLDGEKQRITRDAVQARVFGNENKENDMILSASAPIGSLNHSQNLRHARHQNTGLQKAKRETLDPTSPSFYLRRKRFSDIEANTPVSNPVKMHYDVKVNSMVQTNEAVTQTAVGKHGGNEDPPMSPRALKSRENRRFLIHYDDDLKNESEARLRGGLSRITERTEMTASACQSPSKNSARGNAGRISDASDGFLCLSNGVQSSVVASQDASTHQPDTDASVCSPGAKLPRYDKYTGEKLEPLCDEATQTGPANTEITPSKTYSKSSPKPGVTPRRSNDKLIKLAQRQRAASDSDARRRPKRKESKDSNLSTPKSLATVTGAVPERIPSCRKRSSDRSESDDAFEFDLMVPSATPDKVSAPLKKPSTPLKNSAAPASKSHRLNATKSLAKKVPRPSRSSLKIPEKAAKVDEGLEGVDAADSTVIGVLEKENKAVGPLIDGNDQVVPVEPDSSMADIIFAERDKQEARLQILRGMLSAVPCTAPEYEECTKAMSKAEAHLESLTKLTQQIQTAILES